MRPVTGLAATTAALALALCGCESSQDHSAQLQKQGQKAISSQRGLVLGARSRDVRIVRTAVVADANGTAAAVVLRNLRTFPLSVVPIAINVVGPGGKSVFRNDAPGLQTSLVSVSALAPGSQLTWVNDQVTPTDTAMAVHAEVGNARDRAPATLPRVDVGQPHLVNDPVSGLEAVGKVVNRSTVTQIKLFVYVSAWRGDRLVAAGRGAIAKLTPRAHANYHVYLIGNPNSAHFDVAAPPTVLR
jgi:hypothetical protein